MPADVTLSQEYIAKLMTEADILRERESEYIRQAQTQERCIVSLRRRVSELESELRRSHVHNEG